MGEQSRKAKMVYRKTTDQVTEFMLAFDPPQDPDFWMMLIKEELAETQEALAHLLKERADLAYVIAGLINSVGPTEAPRLIAKHGLHPAITLVCTQTAGITPVLAEAFKRVHESNMSKLGDDGKPVRREDGKIMKGPNYRAPDLQDLVTP